MTTLTGLRFLVVEDETMVAMLIEDMLEGFGSVVVEVAGSLSQGLVCARDQGLDIDAAILDVNLGGEKVYPVAETLADRGVPFVFSTGYGRDGMAPRFARFPVLAKPFSPQALETALLSALAGPPPTMLPG